MEQVTPLAPPSGVEKKREKKGGQITLLGVFFTEQASMATLLLLEYI